MSRSIRATRAGAFATAVLAALAFGSVSALASPPPAAGDHCTDPFADGQCTTQAQCRSLCAGKGYTASWCAVIPHCCYCSLG